MNDIANVITGIEKTAFEVLMWIIFIPKTLIKVIINPDWVPSYVKKEVAKEPSARFQGYISPIFLLLIASVVPFAVVQLIPPPSVEIIGPEEGLVNEEYYFSLQETFLWSRKPVNYEYEVQALYLDPNTEEYKFVTKETASIPDNEGDIDPWFTYTWNEAGIYLIYLSARNGMNEWAENYHFIWIYEDPESLVGSTDSSNFDTPSKDEEAYTQNQGLDPNALIDKFKEGLTLWYALIFLTFPLLFSLIIEFIRKGTIDRDSLQEMFYIQCLYFSPLYFSFSSLLIAGSFWFPPSDDSQSSSPTDHLMLLTAIWFLGIIIWFLINEGRVINSELSAVGIKAWQAKVIFPLCIAASIILFSVGYILFGDDYPDISKLIIWYNYDWLFGVLIAVYFLRSLYRKIFRRDTYEKILVRLCTLLISYYVK